jgi:hypothetical protein
VVMAEGKQAVSDLAVKVARLRVEIRQATLDLPAMERERRAKIHPPILKVDRRRP